MKKINSFQLECMANSNIQVSNSVIDFRAKMHTSVNSFIIIFFGKMQVFLGLPTNAINP